jgi:hypothetical protein
LNTGPAAAGGKAKEKRNAAVVRAERRHSITW